MFKILGIHTAKGLEKFIDDADSILNLVVMPRSLNNDIDFKRASVLLYNSELYKDTFDTVACSGVMSKLYIIVNGSYFENAKGTLTRFMDAVNLPVDSILVVLHPTLLN